MIDLLIKDTKAIGKERPRFNFKTHTTYTPTKTKNYEKLIKDEFWKWYTLDDCIMEEPVELKIRAYYKIPTSYTKSKKIACIGQPYLNKPDCDNIAKAILDALNGLAYRDDKQVAKIVVVKMYDEFEDRIQIKVDRYKGEELWS